MMVSATEKFNKPYREVVKLVEKDFSDLQAGEKMLISSPKSIASYIRNIPSGSETTVKSMRRELARRAKADNTCPLTTGIFLKIAVEASLERSAGAKPDLPFWRIMGARHPLVKKLPISEEYVCALRKSEGLSV